MDDFLSIEESFLNNNFDPDELDDIDDLSDKYPDLDDDELYQKQVKKSSKFKNWKDTKFAYCHHINTSSPSLVTFDWYPLSEVAGDIYFLEFNPTHDSYEYSWTLADQILEQSKKIRESSLPANEEEEQFKILEEEAISLFKANQYLSELDSKNLSKQIRKLIKA